MFSLTVLGRNVYVFSSPEPKAHCWAYRIGRPPSSVCHTSSTLFKQLLLRNCLANQSQFHMEPPWDAVTKVYSNGPGHMTKMAAMSICGKNLEKSSSPEPKGWWPWKLVCSIGYSSSTCEEGLFFQLTLFTLLSTVLTCSLCKPHLSKSEDQRLSWHR